MRQSALRPVSGEGARENEEGAGALFLLVKEVLERDEEEVMEEALHRAALLLTFPFLLEQESSLEDKIYDPLEGVVRSVAEAYGIQLSEGAVEDIVLALMMTVEGIVKEMRLTAPFGRFNSEREALKEALKRRFTEGTLKKIASEVVAWAFLYYLTTECKGEEAAELVAKLTSALIDSLLG